MPEAQCMASRIGIASWLSLQLNVSLSNAKKLTEMTDHKQSWAVHRTQISLSKMKKAYIQILQSLPSTTINCFIG